MAYVARLAAYHQSIGSKHFNQSIAAVYDINGKR